MVIFDIIILLLLLIALCVGFRQGIAVQLGGIAGLFVGVYLAFRFGRNVGGWLGLDADLAAPVGFLLVVIVVILCVGLISRILRGVFRFAGLAMLDKLGGAVLSLLKMGLILSLLLYCFDVFNRHGEWLGQHKLDSSKLYDPMLRVASGSFPYIEMVRDRLLEPDEDAPQRNRSGEQRQTTTLAAPAPQSNELPSASEAGDEPRLQTV